MLPEVDSAVDLFRRADADRTWLAALLKRAPSRLLYVGHASAADRAHGYADRAAIHLACTSALPGGAEPVGDHRPLLAADLMSAQLPMPPRVALLACGSGGDYQFDEATGLVAAMVLCGSQLVTATLWSLPTTAGYRRFTSSIGDPMADVVIAVDAAHQADDARSRSTAGSAPRCGAGGPATPAPARCTGRRWRRSAWTVPGERVMPAARTPRSWTRRPGGSRRR